MCDLFGDAQAHIYKNVFKYNRIFDNLYVCELFCAAILKLVVQISTASAN